MNITDNNNNISVTAKQNDHATPDDQKSESSSPIIIKNPLIPLKNDACLQLQCLNSSNAGNDHNGVGIEPVKGDQSSSGVDTFIGAGLENLGNTCFLNSVLQCLTYTQPLAEYLQNGMHQLSCQTAGFCALCAVQKHVSCALQSSGKRLAPLDLFIHLQCISQTFKFFRQEDAHEYMVNLLETMHMCCLPSGVPTQSPACEKSLVYNIFGGRLRSQLKCMQCNYCSNKFEQFLDLSLDIVKANTLYQAFSHFTAKELLDGGAKQYNCEQCKQKVKALKQLTIHDAPNVLIIHLKRFGAHMSGQKINKKVFFPPNLDLKPFVTGSYDGNLRYTLYGVLVHAGRNTYSGHYYCYVRTSSGNWYLLDDDEVTRVKDWMVFEDKAYMLFYFRNSKNVPAKKVVGVVHQKETAVNSMGINTSCPIVSKEKMVDQKVVSESCLESFPLLPQQHDMVNGPSVLHETIISNISVVKGHDIDDAAKVGSASLTNDATVPSTSNGPQMLCPVNDQREAVLTTVQEHEEKSTHDDSCDLTVNMANDATVPSTSNGPQMLCPVNDQREAVLSTVQEHEVKSTHDDLCDLTVNVADDATVPFISNGPQMLCPVNGHKEDVLTTTQEHEEKRSTHDNLSDLTANVANDVTVPSSSNGPQMLCPVNDQREVVLTTLQEHEEKRNIHDDLCDFTVNVANNATVPSTSNGLQILCPVNDQREVVLTKVQEHEEKSTQDDLCDLTVHVANDANVPSTSNGPQMFCPVNDQREGVLTTVQEYEEKSTHDDLCDLTVNVANDATLPSTSNGPQMFCPVNDQREGVLTTVQEQEEKRTHDDLCDLTVNVANDATLPSISNGPQMLWPVNGQKEIVLTTVQEDKEKRSTHDNLCDLSAVMICSNPQEDSGVPSRVAKEDVAPVEPCCSNGAGDSLKEAFTSTLSIDAGDSLKGAITSTERSSLPKMETFTTNELSQDVALVEPCCNGAGYDLKGAIVSTEASNLPKVEYFSIEKKVLDSRRHKKRKNHLKVSITSMKLCRVGPFLNQQKKKKHNRKKRSKLPINNVHVNTGSKIEDKTSNILVNRIHNELRERVNSVCGESSSVTEPESSNNCMTQIFEDKIVPRWDTIGSTPSQIRETQDVQSAGYVGDKWDEELVRGKRKRRRGGLSHKYDGRNGFKDIAELDRGKRKRRRGGLSHKYDGRNGFQDIAELDRGKMKRRRGGLSHKFDRRNGFQDIADERLNSHAGKRKKPRKKHSKRFSRSGKRPYRR